MDPLVRDAQLLFGEEPRPLTVRQLPRILDVIMSISCFMLDQTVKFKEKAIQACADKCIEVYAGIAPDIVLYPRKQIVEKLRKVWDRYQVARKEVSIDKRTGKMRLSSTAAKKTDGHNTKKFNFNFQENCKQLFDIFKSVPSQEEAFMADQKGPRKIKRTPTAADSFLDPSPPIETEEAVGACGFASQKSNSSNYSYSSSAPSNSQHNDSDYLPPDEPSDSKGAKPKKKLNKQTLEDGDRYNLSNAVVADIVYKESEVEYTDEGIRKARIRHREKNANLDFSDKTILCCGFDEKIDNCVTKDRRKSTNKVENVSVVLYDKDGIEYNAGFYEAASGKAVDVATGLFNYLLLIKVNLDLLIALNSDGCPKMLGHGGGVHACFERLVGRPLQRVICLFHSLEKFFGWLFEYHGGQTEGPSSLKPPWSFLVLRLDLEKSAINPNFVPIPNYFLGQLLDKQDEMMKRLKIKLSKDHEIFIGLVRAIITGVWFDVVKGEKVPKKILMRVIGPVVKSRFTTLECRILRAYLSETNPCPQIVKIVNRVGNI